MASNFRRPWALVLYRSLPSVSRRLNLSSSSLQRYRVLRGAAPPIRGVMDLNSSRQYSRIRIHRLAFPVIATHTSQFHGGNWEHNQAQMPFSQATGAAGRRQGSSGISTLSGRFLCSARVLSRSLVDLHTTCCSACHLSICSHTLSSLRLRSARYTGNLAKNSAAGISSSSSSNTRSGD